MMEVVVSARDALHEACEQGDLASVRKYMVLLRSRAEGDPTTSLLRFLDRITRPLSTHAWHTRGEPETPLHVAARSQRLEVCRWLLSEECRRELDFSFSDVHGGTHSSESYLAFMLGCLRSCILTTDRKVDLGIVRLFVNQMRTKKGFHRANYINQFSNLHSSMPPSSSPYMCLNSDVIAYLLKCFLEFCKTQRTPCAGRRLMEFNLIRITECPSERFCAEQVGNALLQILREDEFDMAPRPLHPPHLLLGPFNAPWRFGLRFAEVALACRWIPETWETLLRYIMQDSRWVKLDGDVLARWIRRLDASALNLQTAVDLAVIVVYSSVDAKGARGDVAARPPAFLLLRIIEGHPEFTTVLKKVTALAQHSKYHEPTMTSFLLRHHRRGDQKMAAKIVSGAHGSVAASAYYQLAAAHRTSFASPTVVGMMLAAGSKQLLCVVVWESNATLSQILFRLLGFGTNGNGWRLKPEIAWIREMYNLRVLLGARREEEAAESSSSSHPPRHFSEIGIRNHRLRPFPFLPSPAVLNILGFGWFGEVVNCA